MAKNKSNKNNEKFDGYLLGIDLAQENDFYATHEPENSSSAIEQIEVNNTINGFVDNCYKLNIRKAPDTLSTVIAVVEANEKFEIDDTKSTDDWYYVSNNDGVSGYCLKQYIRIEK